MAIMCRNHRGFVESTIACSKLGAGALYLNTAFAAPQIADVLERENPLAVIYDEEFAGLIADGAAQRLRFVAWSEPGAARGEDETLEQLIARGEDSDLDPPAESGRVVILTSGTTGAPKGAARKQPDSLEPVAALFSKIPLRARETTMIAAPMFHSWGFAHFTLALPLCSTLVLTPQVRPGGDAARRFPAPRQRARAGAGDAAAHPRPAGRDDRPLRHEQPQGDRDERLGPPRRARAACDGHLRRRALQPVRLDRGGVGDDRHAAGSAGGARHGRQAAARHDREAARPARARGPQG